MMRALAAVIGVLFACSGAAADARVGSKSFTESYLLAEIVARLVEEAGEVAAARRFGLGGTGIVYRALETGEIDVYPEYTGRSAAPSSATPRWRRSKRSVSRCAAGGSR